MRVKGRPARQTPLDHPMLFESDLSTDDQLVHRFEAYAIKEIEKAQREGKPLHALLTALQYKNEPLLPSKVNKKARRENQPKEG